MKKRLFALFLVVAVLATINSSALAVTAQYPTTRAFLNVMDDADLEYTYVGINNDGDEKVKTSFVGDYKDNIDVVIFYNSDLNEVDFFVWDLILFNKDDYNKVLRVIDELNSHWKFATFYVDQSNWSVSVSNEMHIRSSSICAEMALDELYSIVNVSDKGYDLLRVYEKN